MLVGNINKWMAVFAIHLVSVPETEVEEREKIIATHKQILLDTCVKDSYMHIENDEVAQSGIWSAPDVKGIENSESFPSCGMWRQPSNVLDIKGEEKQKSNLWFDPILWGE